MTSGTTGQLKQIRGKRGGTNKGKGAPPAHLISFLVQACATLPDFVLVFAKVSVFCLRGVLFSLMSFLSLLRGSAGCFWCGFLDP